MLRALWSRRKRCFGTEAITAGRGTVDQRRNMRVRLVIVITCALAIGVTAGSAHADPLDGNAVTLTLFNCSGPAGTPSSFDATKNLNGATAFHLVDGTANFQRVFVQDLVTGEGGPLPGNGRDNHPLVTCNVISKRTGDLLLVEGFFTPVAASQP
jgi:hypothetical protein